MLNEAMQSRIDRGNVKRDPIIRSASRINPTLVVLIANILETSTFVFSGVAMRIISGAGSPSSNAIKLLSIISACILHFYLKSLKKTSIAQQMKPLLRWQIYSLLTVAVPIFAVALLVAGVSQSIEGAFDYLSVSQMLWLWAAGATVGVSILRVCIWCLANNWRRHGRLVQSVVIVGGGELAERLLQYISRNHDDLIRVAGVYDDRRRVRAGGPALCRRIDGTIDDLLIRSPTMQLDRVFVALPHAAEQRLLYVLGKLKRLPADIVLAPDLVGFAVVEGRNKQGSSLPLFEVYARPLKVGERVAKEVFDRITAAVLLAALAPTLLIISLIIYLDSGGPILFRQARYGLGHRTIEVLKFRTMYAASTDAECRRQTEVNDARTTPVGRWLRRTSLDELPQLFNVLRGEMSLVGPRPLAVHMRVENELNHEVISEYSFRHRVKPGITGWAQVHGLRGAILSRELLHERVIYDLNYIDNWSFGLDLRIMFLTIGAIIWPRNAY
jgi:Undecaprenyl-phosphate glucose phosphotransferase